MDALLMCGGRGTRLGGAEKPLQWVAGQSLIERVRDALHESRVETTYDVTSPNAPETAEIVPDPVIETPGEGYVEDLQFALEDDRVSTPVLTVGSDLPLLDGHTVDRVIEVSEGDTVTAAVPVGRVGALGFSADTTMRDRGKAVRPVGLNVVASTPERIWVTRDRQLAANINRPRDLKVASWLLASDDEHKH